MPTIRMLADRLRELRTDAETDGPAADARHEELATFERRIGDALVGVVEDIAETLGDRMVPFDPRAAPGRGAPHGPGHPAGSFSNTIERAAEDGARTISVVAPVGLGFPSLGWAAGRGDVLVVAAGDAFADQAASIVRGMPCGDAAGTGSFTSIQRLKRLVGKEGPGTVTASAILLLERPPALDDAALALVDEVRSIRPDVLVVYERGCGRDREFPGTDAVVVLDDQSFPFEKQEASTLGM